MTKQSNRAARPRVESTEHAIEVRHRGKTVTYPIVKLNNGKNGEQATHRVALPDGSFVREQDVPGTFIRYVSNGDRNEDK
jgi:hypothetical protein